MGVVRQVLKGTLPSATFKPAFVKLFFLLIRVSPHIPVHVSFSKYTAYPASGTFPKHHVSWKDKPVLLFRQYIPKNIFVDIIIKCG